MFLGGGGESWNKDGKNDEKECSCRPDQGSVRAAGHYTHTATSFCNKNISCT